MLFPSPSYRPSVSRLFPLIPMRMRRPGINHSVPTLSALCPPGRPVYRSWKRGVWGERRDGCWVGREVGAGTGHHHSVATIT